MAPLAVHKLHRRPTTNAVTDSDQQRVASKVVDAGRYMYIAAMLQHLPVVAGAAAAAAAAAATARSNRSPSSRSMPLRRSHVHAAHRIART
jgi:hypothetical protein